MVSKVVEGVYKMEKAVYALVDGVFVSRDEKTGRYTFAKNSRINKVLERKDRYSVRPEHVKEFHLPLEFTR